MFKPLPNDCWLDFDWSNGEPELVIENCNGFVTHCDTVEEAEKLVKDLKEGRKTLKDVQQ